MEQHPLPLHASIELVSDRYAARGVPRGTRGYILDVYGSEAYEVQFFDANQHPIDWFAIEQREARPLNGDGA